MKDFKANRQNVLIMSAEISRLEAEFGVLPTDPADDVLKDG